MKLQRWWRGVLLLKLRTRSAIIIQTHFRGWIARKRAIRERHRITVIQVSYATFSSHALQKFFFEWCHCA